MKLRKELEWFVKKMEKTLSLNDHKSSYTLEDNEYLKSKLVEEVGELLQAINKDWSKAIIREAVDVANVAMMIAANESGKEF
jgi:NTP pyrophosphatase (non-canonical NTP hydrolase)